LLISTLILGGMLIPFEAQVQNRRVAETQKIMAEIKEALIGYAVINKRLPRPASSSSVGTEKTLPCGSHGACTGFVPWATLGVRKLDAWGKIINYSVSPGFTDSSGITLTSNGSKTVYYTSPFAANPLLTNNIPVVIWSSGTKNFGTSDLGSGTTLPNNSTTNVDEVKNATDAQTFVSRTTTDQTTATGGEFDDLMTWIPTEIIITRMITAGQLP
ncbi:MAG TPA: hypothetical protein VM532_15310, partial [Burkholderiales bacterium]|nr:hypothetical protein [Burkholderiales bacterium]